MKRKANSQTQTSGKRRALAACLGVAALSAAGVAQAQSFDSRSTGNDGALDLTGTPAHTSVDLNPKTMHVPGSSTAYIDPEGDNVFNFTTITIPADVTLKLSSQFLNGPVYLLATGAVNIQGTIDASGDNGHDRTMTTALRQPARPGPGGYPGGIGGNYGPNSFGLAQPGAGPGGGIAKNAYDPSVGYHGPGYGAVLTASTNLVPLLGGSGGGGGGTDEYQWWGSGGGAGGGALLVSSSASINVTGNIYANGGASGWYRSGLGGCQHYTGGGGGGGSIRLVAPVLQGNGSLQTYGNGSNMNNCRAIPWVAQAGRVRLEAFQHSWTYGIPYGSYSQGSPLNSFIPTTAPPSIQVISVAGQQLPANPTGSFDTADVTIDTRDGVPIVIKANYVPAGTVPKLYLSSLEGNDQVIDAPPLVAVPDSTTQETRSTIPATQGVKFSSGFSRGYVRAVWTPPS